MTTDCPGMPPEIAATIAEIMTKIKPAMRTEQGQEDGRNYTYASVDDVFAALQKIMGESGLIFEMLDGGSDNGEHQAIVQLGDRVGFHMRLIPTFTLVGEEIDEDGNAINAHEVARYSNPRAVVHAIAIIDGGNSVLGQRTLAERVYLRNLFKLPTIAQPDAAEETSGHSAAGIGAPRPDAVESSNGSAKEPRRPRNPLMLDIDKSATERTRILDEIKAAESASSIDDAFKRNQVIYAKLQPHDQQLIKAMIAQRTIALNGAAA